MGHRNSRLGSYVQGVEPKKQEQFPTLENIPHCINFHCFKINLDDLSLFFFFSKNDSQSQDVKKKGIRGGL